MSSDQPRKFRRDAGQNPDPVKAAAPVFGELAAVTGDSAADPAGFRARVGGAVHV